MVCLKVPIHWWRVQHLASSSRARERQEPGWLPQLLGGLGWAATVRGRIGTSQVPSRQSLEQGYIGTFLPRGRGRGGPSTLLGSAFTCSTQAASRQIKSGLCTARKRYNQCSDAISRLSQSRSGPCANLAASLPPYSHRPQVPTLGDSDY